MTTPPPPLPAPRAARIARPRLPPEQDALLQRFAKENAFRQWSRIARSMHRRHKLARDVYHRPFTARDDDELLRLHRRLGDRWKEIGSAVSGRSSRIMKRRCKELRRSGFLAAAATAARKELPAGEDTDDMVESVDEPLESPRRLALADALASSFASCSLAPDHPMDPPLAGSLELGFACMKIG
ncbi:transcription factor MYB118-like [Oryza brachyantha]|uniref:transcription factor MYB118-like n=1 Tax=Oryza brachyantha TaxID=4533 RepID=UPI001ADAA76B|nr:transcription factor MYB118-like [Oryza brachyantha]